MNIKLFKPVSYAFTAQIVALFVSVFMSFFVSRYISISNYGYYQLFLFYSTYMPLLQFGVSEGVYLENGGKSYNSLNYDELYLLFYNVLICNLIISTLVILVSLAFDVNRTIVFLELIFAIVNLFFSYYGLLLQSSRRTTEYSFSVIVGKLLTLFFFVVFAFLKVDNYIWYCGSFIIGHLLSSIIVTMKCKEIAFRRTKFVFILLEKKKTIISGLSLLVSGLASSFLIGINRIMIEINYGIDSFAKVSMALNLINFFILFAIQFGMVLFPELATLDNEEKKQTYVNLLNYSSFVFPIIIVLYLPIKYLLTMWIPKYTDSINWMLLFIPYMLYEIRTQIMYNTYIKIMREEKKLLLTNVVVLFFAALVGYTLLHFTNSLELLFVSINIIMIIKSFFLSQIIERKMGINKWLRFIGEAILVLCVIIVLYYHLNS